MANDKTYYTVAETASLVRQALKQAFPSTKFSVRSKSYSGGASINVNWIDGPLTAEVERVAKQFEGATFDGMTDLKSYVSEKVVDDNGTVREIHYGADFVFCTRRCSERLYRRAIGYLNAKYGYSIPENALVVSEHDCWISREHDRHISDRNDYLSHIVNRTGYSMTNSGCVVTRGLR